LRRQSFPRSSHVARGTPVNNGSSYVKHVFRFALSRAIANCQTYGRSLMLHIKIASTSNIQIALPAFLWSSQRNMKLSQRSNCCNDHIVATIMQQNVTKLLQCWSRCFKNLSNFRRKHEWIFTKPLNRHFTFSSASFASSAVKMINYQVIPCSYFKFLCLKLKFNIARTIASLCDITYQPWNDYVYLRVTLQDNRIEKPRYSELNQKFTDPLQATPKTGDHWTRYLGKITAPRRSGS